MRIYRKCNLALALTSILAAGVGYAEEPASNAAVVAATKDVVTAVNQVNASVQSIPQQTVELLLPQFQAINAKQAEIWNKNVGLQADQQFSNNSSSAAYPTYLLLQNMGYNASEQMVAANNGVPQQAVQWVIDGENVIKNHPGCLANTSHLLPQNVQTPAEIEAYCYKDSLGNDYRQQMVALSQIQYQAEAVQSGEISQQSWALLTPLLKSTNLSSAVTLIPFYILGEIQSSRTPTMDAEGKVTAPSMMAALESAVQQPFTKEWQDTMAQASLLDAVRAQNVLLAESNYLQYQRLKAEQQTQALLIAQMAAMVQLTKQ